MHCTTAVSTAENILLIDRSMVSLPGSSAIEPVLVVTFPCVLGEFVGLGPCRALKAPVRSPIMRSMSPSGVL